MKILEKKVASESLWQTSLSFIAEHNTADIHYHHCYKIVVTLDNSFECLIDGHSYEGIRGFIINKAIPHQCIAPQSVVLVNFIETDCLLGRKLKDYLDGESWVDLGQILDPLQFNGVLPLNFRDLSNEELIPYVDRFLNSLVPGDESSAEFQEDSRVQIALEYINQNLHRRMDLEEISGEINLSIERTRHLFADRMGIPFSQYVLWQRIRKTMSAAVTEECKLTTASLQFGFMDQPHFNKTFKKIFGQPPVAIIRYCRILL